MEAFTISKDRISEFKLQMICSKGVSASIRLRFTRIKELTADNEKLALLSMINDELDREEKEITTIFELIDKMEADIDTASDIRLALRNMDMISENIGSILDKLEAMYH